MRPGRVQSAVGFPGILTGLPCLASMALGIALAATPPLACGPAEPPPAPTDPGVERIDNPAEPAWADRQGPPMRFVFEQSFGAENEPYEAILSPIREGIAVDDEGNLYLVVAGSGASRLLSFAPDGSLRWTVERQGEGPGELMRAGGVVWGGGDRIYVSNANYTRIDEWSTDGEFLRSRVLAELGLPMAVVRGAVGPGRLVVRGFGAGSSESTGQPLTFVDVDPEWRVRLETTVDVNPRLELPEGEWLSVGFTTHLDGTVAFGNVGAYEVRFFDENAELQRIVTVDTDRIVRPGVAWNEGDATVEEYGEVRPPLRLASGHWLVHARWPTNLDDPDEHARLEALDRAPPLEWRSSLDLFDAGGRFLASMEWEGGRPEFGFPLASGADGGLYVIVGEPYLQVRRYRVELLHGTDR